MKPAHVKNVRLAAAVVDKRVFSYYQHKLGLGQLLVGPANLTRRLPLHACPPSSPHHPHQACYYFHLVLR